MKQDKNPQTNDEELLVYLQKQIAAGLGVSEKYLGDPPSINGYQTAINIRNSINGR